MKLLTVFTPTFNRQHLLPRLYESLVKQTSKNFLWLIIDDGSSDGTEALVKSWIKEEKIMVLYHYKENGGMHTGHNAAYKIISTELNVCIDSDDAMPPDAVEKIESKWKETQNALQTAGIIGLDADDNGQILGTKIPKNLTKGSLHDLYFKHGVTGDKKLVLRTDIVKKYPAYPEFEKEKLVPLGILYLMIGQDYDLLYSNDVYCIVEYQQDGSSNSILKQYFQSPEGFAYARSIQKKYSDSFKQDCKNSVHIGISTLVTKKWSLLNLRPKIFLNYMMFPVAVVAYAIIKLKIK